jgi:hypothetical protein
MANMNISPEKTVIDPRFDIPEGLDSFVYDEPTEAELAALEEEDSDVITIYTGEPMDGDYEDVNHEAPPTPEMFTIVSQKIKMSPDGRQLVDVEIETEDIPGVRQLDVRVTKT